MAEPKQKPTYVGAPAIFALELCCQQVTQAFDVRGYSGCYLVGSAIERPDWRDVDIRLIMADEEFAALFPDSHMESALWEHDPRWLLMTLAISEWMRKCTGLPVDFQFQPQTFANKRHDKTRHAIGLRVARNEREGERA